MKLKFYFWRYLRGKYDAFKEKEQKQKIYFKHSKSAKDLLLNDSENSILKSLILGSENIIQSFPKEREAELREFAFKLLLSIADPKKQTKAELELYEELEDL